MTPPGGSTLGSRLRQQRERQDIPLDRIAAETKIKLSLLEGLERDDISRWPEGIYRRAYVRAYAVRIGLEPDAVVREFLELYPDGVEMPPAAAGVWAEPTRDPQAPQPTTLRRLVTSAMAAVPTFLHRTDGAAPPARASIADDGELRGIAAPPAPPADDSAVEAGARAVPGEPVGDASAVDALAPAPEIAPAQSRPARRARAALSLASAARCCTRIGRAVDRRDLESALDDVARLVDAVGLVVWSWDSLANALTPVLVRGYPDALRARFPSVPAGEENAVAAAFRSAQTCVVDGRDDLTGAVAVPLLGAGGSVGVLALEFRDGREQSSAVHDLAAIVAAQLVPFFQAPLLAEAITA